jgi:hypothetical protein
LRLSRGSSSTRSMTEVVPVSVELEVAVPA